MLKPVEWISSSKSALKKFPVTVQDQVGFALYQAQAGLKHRDAKPLKGFGAHVLEVISRHDGDTYRAVYERQIAGPVQSCRLCPARLPEEGQTGHRNPEAGDRSGQAQA